MKKLYLKKLNYFIFYFIIFVFYKKYEFNGLSQKNNNLSEINDYLSISKKWKIFFR